MTFRSAPWRRSCPDLVSKAIDEALRATIYIVHVAGPTGFVLKQEGETKKHKVFLGDQHNCSCSAFRKKHEVCLHILWILLKKFRIPRENPVIWQLGLIEREINEILLGHLRKQSPVHSASRQPSDQKTVQRDIGPDDICPICQDELLSQQQKALTFCKYGCGKSVHLKCMKVWADHQRSTGESVIRCPLCRENFGAISEIPSKSPRRVRAEKAFLHLGMACTHCHVCPIAGKCYRCCQCASYYLCHACFSSNQVHLLHSFEMRQHCNQPWREAERSRESGMTIPPSDSPALPPALINSLQSRSLTENDYELLLQLDDSQSTSIAPPTGDVPDSVATHRSHGSGHHLRHSVPEAVINSFHVEPLDGNHPLIAGRESCQVCYSTFCRGDWIRKLPCKHKFHRECIDEWLRSNHITCPIDGLPVYDPTNQRRLHPLQGRKRSTANRRRRSRQLAPLSQAALQARQDNAGVSEGGESLKQAEFTISGQSISGGSRQTSSRRSAYSSRVSGLRRGISSQSPLKQTNALAHGSSLLPKLEQRQIVSCIHPRRHQTEQKEDISLPKINSTSVDNVTLRRTPSESNSKTNSTKRLTIQIPTASGDHAVGATTTTRERHSKTNNYHSASSRAHTASVVTHVKSKNNHSLPERMSEESTLLAPICSSYSSSVGQQTGGSYRSIDHCAAAVVEGTALHLARAVTATENSPRKSNEELVGEHQSQLAVLPAISNLQTASPRGSNKQNSSLSSSSTSPMSSMIGSKRLKRGSLVIGDKSTKRSISLRDSASDLLDTSLQVCSFKPAPPEEHRSNNTITIPSIDLCSISYS